MCLPPYWEIQVTWGPGELSDAAGQHRGDVRERVVEAGSKKLHSGNCAECDQSHDQRILDKILAFLALDELTNRQKELGSKCSHCSSLQWIQLFRMVNRSEDSGNTTSG